jgi:conjugal transfer pilus assembly protein TrbC
VANLRKITTFTLLTVLIGLFSGSAFAEMKKYYIDTPTPCVKVEKIDRNKVYLLSTQEKCLQATGKAQIEIDSSFKYVYTYVDNVFWKEQKLQEFGVEGVSNLLEQSEQMAKIFKLPENIYKESGLIEAKKSADFYHSKEFQDKLAAEKDRIASVLFNETPKSSASAGYYKDPGKKDGKMQGRLRSDERIYIFISSSMPITTIRNYAEAVDNLGGNITMVMRGFINGMRMVKPTMKFIEGILKKDETCDLKSENCETFRLEVQIDPILFQRFGIQKVPAIVYAKGVNVLNTGSEGIEGNVKVDDFYVVYGDVGIPYAIRKIQDAGGLKDFDEGKK